MKRLSLLMFVGCSSGPIEELPRTEILGSEQYETWMQFSSFCDEKPLARMSRSDEGDRTILDCTLSRVSFHLVYRSGSLSRISITAPTLGERVQTFDRVFASMLPEHIGAAMRRSIYDPDGPQYVLGDAYIGVDWDDSSIAWEVRKLRR